MNPIVKFSLAVFVFFLTAPAISQADPIYGLFMIVKGDVSFKNLNAPAEKAKVGAKVYEGASITTEKDSRAKIVMSDRNVFNLSPDSKLTIQKYDSTAGKKNVSLSLLEGKVRVNVEQKYDGAKEKFLLKTPTVVAGVRGTQFLAGYDSGTKTSQVTTFKGAVAMTSFSANGQPISNVRIEKGQSAEAQLNRPPDAPKNIPAQELKELDKSASATGQGSGTERKEAKIANGRDTTDTEIAKDIKTSPDTGKTAAVLAPPPPTQPIVPPPVKPPTIPPYTNVKIIIQ